jgi:competence protein ComEA
LLVVATATGGYVLVDRWPRPEPIHIVPPAVATPAAQVATAASIVVHVVGAVQRPGVYSLAPGSRLDDAVRAAGGLTEEADASRINLADYARDAQQVYVPVKGETPPPGPTTVAGGSVGAGNSEGARGLIPINTASAAQLEALPGIGPALAERIVAYREAHGPFRQPEEIMQVTGIGEARYEQIRSLITIE